MDYKYSVVSPTWLAKQKMQDSHLNLCVFFAFRYESKWILASGAKKMCPRESYTNVTLVNQWSPFSVLVILFLFMLCQIIDVRHRQPGLVPIRTVDVYFKADLFGVFGYSNDRDPPIQKNIKYALCLISVKFVLFYSILKFVIHHCFSQACWI